MAKKTIIISGDRDSLTSKYTAGGGYFVVSKEVNWDTITESGWYFVQGMHETAPPDAYSYGFLIVFSMGENRPCLQIYFPHQSNTGASLDYSFYTRCKWTNQGFKPWKTYSASKIG